MDVPPSSFDMNGACPFNEFTEHDACKYDELSKMCQCVSKVYFELSDVNKTQAKAIMFFQVSASSVLLPSGEPK